VREVDSGGGIKGSSLSDTRGRGKEKKKFQGSGEGEKGEIGVKKIQQSLNEKTKTDFVRKNQKIRKRKIGGKKKAKSRRGKRKAEKKKKKSAGGGGGNKKKRGGEHKGGGKGRQVPG